MPLDGVEVTWLGHAAFRFRLDDGAFPVLAGRPSHLQEHSDGAFAVGELTVGSPVG